MNDKQTRELNASLAGTGVMDYNNSIWSGTASIANKVTAIKANQGVLKAQQAIQEKYRGGVKDSKENARKDAGEKAFGMARVLVAFAVETGNTVLKGEVDFPKTKYWKGKDSTVVGMWDLVKARADSNMTALTSGGYLITTGDVTALQGFIDIFTNWKPKPVMGKAEKKSATTAIKKEVGKMKVNEELLFDLMAPLAATQANFYNAALDGFEVMDSGNRHIANWFTFVDDVTGVRLDGVNGSNEALSLRKKSSKRGVIKFMYEETGNGNYSYMFSKPRYRAVEMTNVKSEEGKMNKIEVRMVLS